MLFFGSLAAISNMYLVQPILPELSATFGVSEATASLALSVTTLANAFGIVFAGPISDRFGRKRVMVASGFLLTIPSVLAGFAASFGSLVILRAFQGLFIAGLPSVALAYTAESFPAKIRGAITGLLVTSWLIGGYSGRVFGGLLTDHFGLTSAFVTFGSLAGLGALLMLVALPESSFARDRSIGDSYAGMVRHFHNRRLVGAFIIGFSFLFGYLGVFSYLSYYLMQPPYNLSLSSVSLIYAIGLAGMVSSPIAGYLSDRFGRTPVMAAGLIIAAGGLFITRASVLAVAIAGFAIFHFGTLCTHSTTGAFIGDEAQSNRGGASGLYLIFYYVGGSIGTVVAGLAWHGAGWTGVLMVALAALAVALASDLLLCRGSR